MIKTKLNDKNRILFEKIIEDATVDCKDEDEQISGWECILGDNITTPCKCRVGKEGAILNEIRQDEHSPFILGIIEINKKKIRTPIEDIFLEDSESMIFIDAYKYWRENG
ncbi:MAG: calcium-binding protein [Nanoarchaeota archaeon]